MKIWLPVVLILIIGGGIFLLTRNNRQAAPSLLIPNQTISPTLLPQPSPELSPTDIPLPLPKTPAAKVPSTVTSGLTRGQLTCNYQVPADPNHQGIAKLNANWNNLQIGTNGQATAAVCVSVNGNIPSLMSLINGANGSTTVSAPWISLTANYNFLLYDQHGTDFPNCAGIQLSSCRINTNK
jgi:hypothetical protein